MRTQHCIAVAAVGILIALTGCTPVHQLKITNISSVPMEFRQEMGDETDTSAQQTLEPGQSTQVYIREGEDIVITDALSIQILGD
jgi:hypothetical protein